MRRIAKREVVLSKMIGVVLVCLLLGLTVSGVVLGESTYYATKDEAVAQVDAHVEPKGCFVWKDGPSATPWRVIPGTGCAHWVAHELGLGIFPSPWQQWEDGDIEPPLPAEAWQVCYDGFYIRVVDVVDGLTELAIAGAEVGDIWTNSGLSHTGIVRQVDEGRVLVEHCSNVAGGVVQDWFSSGRIWRAMVRGIDVSHHQGDIVWADVYDEGIRFAYVKASQGACNIIAEIPAGYEGTVVSGGTKTKQSGTTYTWWQVVFIPYVPGWVADVTLEKVNGEGVETLAPGDTVRTKSVANLRSSPEIATRFADPKHEENVKAINEMKRSPSPPMSREFYSGSYHYATPCLNLEGDDLESEARAEARWFVSSARDYLKSGYMQPMLDLEIADVSYPEWGVHYWDDDGSPVVGTLSAIVGKLGADTTKERLSQWALAWIHEVEEWGRENGLVIRPIVYFHPTWIPYFNEDLIGVIRQNGIWVANYAAVATASGSPYVTDWGDFGARVNHEWQIWQYSETGRISGITGNVDLDHYNGTLDDLRSSLVISRGGLDVFMLVDLTGSFSPYLPAFKAQAPALMASLQASYAAVRFGLGMFRDYPISPFGSSGDKAYQRLIDLTYDVGAVQTMISGLYASGGGDGPESQLVALYQAATGAGQDLSGVGYPGASIPPGQQANFRDGVIKLFILWTDAPFHRPGDSGSIPYLGPSFDETVAAILALDPPMVIGISSGSGGLADLRAIAAATNAVAPPGGVDTTGDGIIDIPEGEPLVASIGYSAHGIAAAIESLISAAVMLPIASAGGPYTGEVGEAIVFDGSESFDPDGWIILYEWDFESDGVFDFSSIEPTAEHVYTAEFSGIATLRVTDNDGNTAIGTAPVEILPRSVIPVESVTVDPETLNLQAPAKWITAYIELPEEHAAEDIDVGTVLLIYHGNELYADWGDLQDGVLMVKFDWATVAGWFVGLHDVEVELTVTGEVAGVDFEGTDTIRVINPSQGRGGR